MRGKPLKKRAAIPRTAIRADDVGRPLVYLVTADGRLRRRRIEIGIEQADYVTVAKGLEAGDRVVISDLTPAVDGMRLQAVTDDLAAERLRTAVTGAGDGS